MIVLATQVLLVVSNGAKSLPFAKPLSSMFLFNNIVYNGKKRAFMIVLLLLDRIISDHGGCAKPGAKGVAAKYRSRSTFLRFIGGYYVLLAMQRLW